jgi:hypothetical protein
VKDHRRRRIALLLVVCCSLAAASCRFIADEFTWLDRVGPLIGERPDQAPPATHSLR